MVIKSNTHTTVVQREERAVVYLCSFEAKTQTDRKKKRKPKKNSLSSKVSIAFFSGQ